MNKNRNKILLFTLILVFTLFFGYNRVFANTGCESKILGPGLSKMVDDALKYLRYFAPVIVIIFGSVDMFKAVISSKEDDMRRSQKLLIKRIIIALCLYFVPIFVELLLKKTDMMCK